MAGRRRFLPVSPVIGLWVLLASGALPLCSWAETSKKVVIVQWAVLATYRTAQTHFEGELRALAQKKNLSIAVETFNAYGDKKALQDFLHGEGAAGADLVVTIGNIATNEALASLPDKPIVFMEVLCADPLILKSPEPRKAPIAGASPDLDLSLCLKKVKENLPNVQRIGVIYTTAQEIPEAQTTKLKAAAAPLGIEVTEEKLELGFCRNEADMKMALEKLSQKCSPQALWILDDGNVNRFLNTIIDYCKAKAIRVIGPPSALKKGGAIAFDVDKVSLAKQAAAQAMTILSGGSTNAPTVVYDSAPKVMFPGSDAATKRD